MSKTANHIVGLSIALDWPRSLLWMVVAGSCRGPLVASFSSASLTVPRTLPQSLSVFCRAGSPSFIDASLISVLNVGLYALSHPTMACTHLEEEENNLSHVGKKRGLVPGVKLPKHQVLGH